MLAFDFEPGSASSNPDSHPLGEKLLLFFSSRQEISVAQGDRARPLRRPRFEFRSGDPSFLTPLGSELVFGANGDPSRALWRTDGTAAGTRRIRTEPGRFSGPVFPRDLIPLGPRHSARAEGDDSAVNPLVSDLTSLLVTLRFSTCFFWGIQFPACWRSC